MSLWPHFLAQLCHVLWGVWAGCSSPLLRPWARRWINHWSLWRMARATPDLRLPSQPQGITAPDRYPVILLGDRGKRERTTCPRLLAENGTAVTRTRDLGISPTENWSTNNASVCVGSLFWCDRVPSGMSCYWRTSSSWNCVLKLLTICGIMRPRARLPSEYLQYVYNETTSVYCSKHYVSQKHVSDKQERRICVTK